MQQAKITILSTVEGRDIQGKNGTKTIYAQRASLETEAMRITVEVEVDGKNNGYRVGEVFDWDIAADLVPGRFGVELARRKTLAPAQAKTVLKTA
jgi:hypothetical protein